MKFKFSDNKFKIVKSREEKTPLVKENMYDSNFSWKFINNKKENFLS